MAASRLETLVRLVQRMGVQKATLVDALPPNARAWRYELKWDGYRIFAIKVGGEVRLITRNRLDWTDEFRVIADAVKTLDCEECVVDGEVCALDARGLPSFQMLQHRQSAPAKLIFAVFDLLWAGGHDLREQPMEARREALELVVGEWRDPAIIISEQFEDDPQAMLALACERGLEGIIAKQKGSRYLGTRAGTWLKIKCKRRQEFVIAGYLPLLGHKAAVGGLVLALHDAEGFYFTGKVGTGFSEKGRYDLAKRLDAIRVERSMVRDMPRLEGLRKCEPKLVCEVEFSEWTDGGNVRHPSFRGLRADKKPEECVREVAVAATAVTPPGEVMVTRASRRKKQQNDSVDVAGVGITHPERVLAPLALTKLALARYYEAVAESMLPHVRGRPLGLVQHRRDHPCGLYLPHDTAFGPHELARVVIRLQKKTGHYLVVHDAAGLVALANFEIIEVHTWMSRTDDLERPDRLVFDVDPDEALPWVDVVQAAKYVRDRLESVGLKSWPRLTGGKGIHVVVPLTPSFGWDDGLAFARAFAAEVQRAEPDAFVLKTGAPERRGKVLLDVLRNARASTAIESYSTRARPGDPVCVPLSWSELLRQKTRKMFTTRDVLTRLRRKNDPWADYFREENRPKVR